MKKTKIKIVDIKKIRFAPEIEVEFPSKVDAYKVMSDKTIKGWDLKSDATLDNGIEFVPVNENKLYLTKKGLGEIKKVTKWIKKYRGRVSERCGLHVHIDIENFTDEEVVNILQSFIRKQRWIVKEFKVNENRLNEQCSLLPIKWYKKITPKNIAVLRQTGLWNSQYSSFNRYSALNILCVPDTKSIELRLFEGCIKYNELKRIIKWCLKFIKESVEQDYIRGEKGNG